MADQITGYLSPFLRNRRIKAALPYMNGNILDYGCGTGKLAEYIPAKRYLGVDIDKESIDIACTNYAGHRFFTLDNFNIGETKFDTIVSLAVIEHIKDPGSFLGLLTNSLTQNGSIVITTPHPFFESIHKLGSKIGIFSKAANDEHEELIDLERMKYYIKDLPLRIVSYKRFLFFANQLFVFKI